MWHIVLRDTAEFVASLLAFDVALAAWLTVKRYTRPKPVRSDHVKA